MHEFTIAQGIVDFLRETYSAKGYRITSFRIALGELSMFDKNLIIDLVRELIKGTELEGAKFTVSIEEAAIKCESCNQIHTFKELTKALSNDEKEMIHFIPELISSFARCLSCGSRDLKIITGRGVMVTDIAVKKA
jgi:hydrogenase nickel incorporation protein HypA/HybF